PSLTRWVPPSPASGRGVRKSATPRAPLPFTGEGGTRTKCGRVRAASDRAQIARALIKNPIEEADAEIGGEGNFHRVTFERVGNFRQRRGVMHHLQGGFVDQRKATAAFDLRIQHIAVTVEYDHDDSGTFLLLLNRLGGVMLIAPQPAPHLLEII